MSSLQYRWSAAEQASLHTAALVAQVRQFNFAVVGPYEFSPKVLAVYDRDQLCAGVAAHFGLGWLSIEALWVAEPLRGQGIAQQLLKELEQQARIAELRYAKVETASFQARGFYEKQGYRVYAELEDYPPGHSYFYLRKNLHDSLG
ncbi:GNAT family N-acetyltransferase [Balneatrix alpica]|uniref:GNAT family N-acetyltransferase n=1 Tax=Balneatrix alpica TaxID=75684 RepID=A0ABV5ZDQ4_9GAMM|nr:GNAT family N-acetyltransferase [Balneatrix alpica]